MRNSSMFPWPTGLRREEEFPEVLSSLGAARRVQVAQKALEVVSGPHDSAEEIAQEMRKQHLEKLTQSQNQRQ
jgi:hypothetical protein